MILKVGRCAAFGLPDALEVRLAVGGTRKGGRAGRGARGSGKESTRQGGRRDGGKKVLVHMSFPDTNIRPQFFLRSEAVSGSVPMTISRGGYGILTDTY